MNYMENCIFCKIINNEIPSKMIYEDEIVKELEEFLRVSHKMIENMKKEEKSCCMEMRTAHRY